MFHVQAMTELMVTHADLSLEGDGTETPYSLVARPVASMNMSCGLTTFQGKNTKFAGWTYDNFEPFSDAPGKGKKKINWKLVGKYVLGAVAVIAVGVTVTALIVSTGGAAAAALPAVAAVASNKLLIFGMAAGTIAAKTGADALSNMVMDEHHNGNVYSPIDYLTYPSMESMRSGAEIISIMSLPGTAVGIAAAGKYMLSRAKSFVGGIGAGGSQLSLQGVNVGGRVTGNAISVAEVNALSVAQVKSIAESLGLLSAGYGGMMFAKMGSPPVPGGGAGGSSGRNIKIPDSVEKQARKLSPEAKKGYDRAIEGLRNGDLRGLNDHPLSGTRAGQRAVDIKGTGRGRGAGRLIYEIRDNEIHIIEIILNHKY